MEKFVSELRVRMSAKDAHYGGNLVDGAHMLHLFGDVATELLIRCDGDEGVFCAYDNIEFLALRRRLHRSEGRDHLYRKYVPQDDLYRVQGHYS